MILPWPQGKERPPRAKKPKCEHVYERLELQSGKFIGLRCQKCRKMFTRDTCDKCGRVKDNVARADRLRWRCSPCTKVHGEA